MENQKQRKELVILHFNDAYDIEPDHHGQLGFLNFYDYVQRLRQKYPEALLIFSGDALAPSKLSRALKGQQMVHCLKMLNIDVACYGNHDFDFQPQHSLKLAKQCGFPWLLGNIKYLQTGENIGEGLDYYILDKNGIKIGFLGLAGPDFNGRLISYYQKKLKYIDITQYAKKICKKLLSLGCQLIIALTHARKPADVDLAKKVPEIDIILGGHDHFSLFQIHNQIPIVKSSSNFECISIVKIFKENLEPQKSKDVRLGRRWFFISECKKVKKSIKEYPQIEAFISNAVKQYRQYQRNKHIPQNKSKKDIPQLPQNKWNLEYRFMNNKASVTLTTGLSAEICFSKYIAFKRKCIYSGFKRAAPILRQNFIQETLGFIEEEVISHHNKGKIALYCPGICSVPYLVQTANMIYLPSHFVVGVNNYSDLVKMLEYSFKKGYKCYAIFQPDPLFENKVCVWIKFIEPPKQYINILKKQRVQDVIIMSYMDEVERNIRLISSQCKEGIKDKPSPKDIYASFALQLDQKMLKDNIIYYSKVIIDKDQTFWLWASSNYECSFINNLEYGMDSIQDIESKFKHNLLQQKINYLFILNADIWRLNLIAYKIGKQFINFNFKEQEHPIKGRGVVMNQYTMSNPTYELNYGYIPILYSPQWKNNQQRILQILSEEQRGFKRWFNMHRNTRLNLIKHDSIKITTDNLGDQLAKWIAKYSPKQYKLKYLQIQQIIECLRKQDYLHKKDENNSLIPI